MLGMDVEDDVDDDNNHSVSLPCVFQRLFPVVKQLKMMTKQVNDDIGVPPDYRLGWHEPS
jgi:hypothetical protein